MILVIGIGSPLRGDDGVGQAAAYELANRLPHTDMEVLGVHQLTPELVEPISRADRVIFLDADVRQEAGQIVTRQIHPLDDHAGAFSHHISPAALLLGARQLYGTAPEGYLISIGAETFAFSEQLSARVQAAFPDYITAAMNLLTP
jgi:hydrogenase maturation protease